MSTQPELGQMVFGNPTGEHECPAWVDALVRDLLRNIERVFWNKNQRSWEGCEDPKIPGIEFRPYYWGSDEAEQAKPNLRHVCTVGECEIDIEVRWYKHPMRGSSLNVEAKPEEMVAWFTSALDAIRKADGLPHGF